MLKFNNQSLAIVPRTQGSSVPPPIDRKKPPGGLKRFKMALNKDVFPPPYLLISGAYIDENENYNGKYFVASDLINDKPSYVSEAGYTITWMLYPNPPIDEKPGFWTIANRIDSNTIDGNSPESNVWNVNEWRNASTGDIIPVVITRVGL
jgi:hypothetical protein